MEDDPTDQVAAAPELQDVEAEEAAVAALETGGYGEAALPLAVSMLGAVALSCLVYGCWRVALGTRRGQALSSLVWTAALRGGHAPAAFDRRLTGLAAVACLSAVFLSFGPPLRGGQSPSTKPSKEIFFGPRYFHVVFSLTWGPGECFESINPKCRVCAQNSNFTIHNLFFNGDQRLSAELRRGHPYLFPNLSDISDRLEKKWPSCLFDNNTEYWEYEWNKHGSYLTALTTLKNQDYFVKALNLTEAFPIARALEARNIIPRSDTKYKLEDVNEALQTQYNTNITLRCKNRQYLREVQFCFDLNFELLGCALPPNCDDNIYYLAPENADSKTAENADSKTAENADSKTAENDIQSD